MLILWKLAKCMSLHILPKKIVNFERRKLEKKFAIVKMEKTIQNSGEYIIEYYCFMLLFYTEKCDIAYGATQYVRAIKRPALSITFV